MTKVAIVTGSSSGIGFETSGKPDDVDRIRAGFNFTNDDISKNTFKQFVEKLS